MNVIILKIKMIIHDNNSVSANGIHYGAETNVTRFLREAARIQKLEAKK